MRLIGLLFITTDLTIPEFMFVIFEFIFLPCWCKCSFHVLCFKVNFNFSCIFSKFFLFLLNWTERSEPFSSFCDIDSHSNCIFLIHYNLTLDVLCSLMLKPLKMVYCFVLVGIMCNKKKRKDDLHQI